MNQSEFREERMVAEERANISEERGVSWAVISFAIIILVMIIGGILFTMLPVNPLNRTNQNTTSGAPIEGR